MTTATAPAVTIADIEFHAADLAGPANAANRRRAAEVYKEHGCLVVRGLFKPFAAQIGAEIRELAETAISLLPQASRSNIGWHTPDGSLFLPAPENFTREQQIMLLPYSYQSSAAFFLSALDTTTLDMVEAILGPDVELMDGGQCVYKEPVGGHPKHLHQDSAYFEHRFEGPVATLNYVVDTGLENGALYVVPGSHKLGQLKHVDTFSHLGLDEEEWPWGAALPVTGQAGDTIFFNVKTIHGSQENHGSEPRPVAISRYRAANDYVVISGTTAENREEAAKQAAKAKKDNQRGFMVRGMRRYEAELA